MCKNISGVNTGWEWRGVCEENSGKNPCDVCGNADGCASDMIERLSKENEELKDLAERRLKRKNMYKERSERYLKEILELRIRVKALENELLSENEEDNDDRSSQKECHEEN